MNFFSAPTSSQALSGTIKTPGSKSITNRALVLAALSDGTSYINNGLESRDSQLMLAALKELGCNIEGSFSKGLSITPPDHYCAGNIYTGLSGTVMRFIPPLASLAEGTIFIDGDKQAYKRPMKPIITALRDIGVYIDGNNLPFIIKGSGHVKGGAVTIDASASSQFISGLLLSGAHYERGITITHQGSVPPSMPHIEMTIRMLNQVGVTVDKLYDQSQQYYSWSVKPSIIHKNIWSIEPDLSNSAIFFAAAAVTGGQVSVPGWNMESLQPIEQVSDIFRRMGTQWHYDSDKGTITVQGVSLQGITADLREINELTPTFVAMAAVAEGPSTFYGIEHIRGHETDRISALTKEINKLGGQCKEHFDGITITPTPLHGGLWQCYADHRIATAGTILGLKVPGIFIEDINATAKTLPQFPQLWENLVHNNL